MNENEKPSQEVYVIQKELQNLNLAEFYKEVKDAIQQNNTNNLYQLSKIIAAMHDSTGHITIPGFYDDVRPLGKEDYEAMKETEEARKQELFEISGINDFWGVPTYSVMERATAQPTCDVNGVFGGYSGEGSKTIIPWEHLLISEQRILKRVNQGRKNKINSIYDLGLNKVSLAQYRSLLSGLGLSIILYRVNANEGSRLHEKMIMKSADLLRKIPRLAEYFSFNLYCVLEKI